MSDEREETGQLAQQVEPEEKNGEPNVEVHPLVTWAVVALILLSLVFILVSRRYLVQTYHWPSGVEQIRYLALLELFKESFWSGTLYPRWLPDLFSGYGYPIFVFYPPGYFHLSTAVSIPLGALSGWYPFLSDRMIQEWIVCMIILMTGAIGAFLLCETLSGRRVGLYCAMLFLLSPYVPMNLQARSDLAELLALCLCPYPFYFFHKLLAEVENGGKKTWIFTTLTGLSSAAVFVSHPAVALFLCFTITIYGFSVSAIHLPLRKKSLMAMACLTLALGLGLAISSPYWFHVIALKSIVNLQRATQGFVNVDNWVASPYLFVKRDVKYFNYYEIGATHMVLAFLGAFLNRRDARFLAAFLIYAAALLSLTSLGAGFWSYFNLVKLVQFPWRVQSILVTLQIILICGIWRKFPSGSQWLTPAMAGALLISFIWYGGSFQWPDRPIPFYPQKRLNAKMNEIYALDDLRFNTFSNVVEYAPLYALNQADYKYPLVSPTPRPPSLAQTDLGACEVHESPSSGKFHIRLSVSGQESCRVRINQIYFPGWMLLVDGSRVDGDTLLRDATPDGAIRIQIPPGAHHVEAWYEGPPHWRERNAAIAAALAVYLLGMVLVCRRRVLGPGNGTTGQNGVNPGQA